MCRFCFFVANKLNEVVIKTLHLALNLGKLCSVVLVVSLVEVCFELSIGAGMRGEQLISKGAI